MKCRKGGQPMPRITNMTPIELDAQAVLYAQLYITREESAQARAHLREVLEHGSPTRAQWRAATLAYWRVRLTRRAARNAERAWRAFHVDLANERLGRALASMASEAS